LATDGLATVGLTTNQELANSEHAAVCFPSSALSYEDTARRQKIAPAIAKVSRMAGIREAKMAIWGETSCAERYLEMRPSRSDDAQDFSG